MSQPQCRGRGDHRSKLNNNFERKSFMKHSLYRISVCLMILGLVGFNSLTALATTRPFHLVEHGTLTDNGDGTTTANGTGTATHLGTISVHRTFTLTKTNVENVLHLEGEAILTAANGD